MRRLFALHAIVILAAMHFVASASAEVITFDEMLPDNSNCCYLTTEYADLGVTFVTTDDGSIWAGLSNGNPGSWFLEGTNRPAFLGFNGASLSASMLFDAPIEGFRLDMGPSIGWSSVDDVLILEGTRAGVLVDRVEVSSPGFGVWTQIALQGEIDAVYMVSQGPTFPNAYGIDNVMWQMSETPNDPPGDLPDDPTRTDDFPEPDGPAGEMSIGIDIKPRHTRNVLNPASRGRLRVALLGSETFDVQSVDIRTLRMGPDDAASTGRARLMDVNRDRRLDLVTSFQMRDLGLDHGDTEICISGSTFDGPSFEGCDSVQTVPSRAHHKHQKNQKNRKSRSRR
jgi:hypothetical protein